MFNPIALASLSTSVAASRLDFNQSFSSTTVSSPSDNPKPDIIMLALLILGLCVLCAAQR